MSDRAYLLERRVTDLEERNKTLVKLNDHLKLMITDLVKADMSEEFPDRRLSIRYAAIHPDLQRLCDELSRFHGLVDHERILRRKMSPTVPSTPKTPQLDGQPMRPRPLPSKPIPARKSTHGVAMSPSIMDRWRRFFQ